MNMKRLRMNALGTTFVMCLVSFIGGTATALASTTYYVDTNNSQANDSNPGTQALPWKTINKANTTMVGGDTSIVAAGTYNETVSTTRSGASGSKITFKASGAVNVSGFNINHSYITVDGFTIPNNQILIGNANYCEVLNNHISNGAIAMLYSSSPTGCLIKGNLLDAAVSPAGDMPQIIIFGTNNVVDSNEIGPSRDIDAFRLWGHNNIIRNNYVHDITYSPGSAAHMDIVQIFGDNGWESYNNIIENNRFINNQGQMFNTSTDNVAGIHDLIFRNNVYAHFAQNGNLGMANMQFYNNTFYDVGMFNGGATGTNGSPGAVFKNNIFINIKGYNPADYSANMFLSGPNTWTIQYNFFSTLSGAALSNFDNQIGGINGGAINFTNVAANDFTLKSPSPAIDHGATLSGFNYDLAGVARPNGSAWDIGAFEYSNSSTQLTGNSIQLNPPTNLTATP